MAEKKVKIIIETVISNDEESKVELVVFGTTAERNGSHYFRYTEITDQGEVKVALKYDGEKIVASRKGPFTIKQIFDENYVTETFMESPMGELHVETTTNAIAFTHDEVAGVKELGIAYNLAVQFETVGSYQLSIRTTEMK